MYIDQGWQLWPQGGFTCLLKQWKFWLHSWSALCNSSYKWAYACLTLCMIYCHYRSSEHWLENLRARTSNCLLHYLLYWHVCIRFSLLLSCVIFANTQNGRTQNSKTSFQHFCGKLGCVQQKNCYYMRSSGGSGCWAVIGEMYQSLSKWFRVIAHYNLHFGAVCYGRFFVIYFRICAIPRRSCYDSLSWKFIFNVMQLLFI